MRRSGRLLLVAAVLILACAAVGCGSDGGATAVADAGDTGGEPPDGAGLYGDDEVAALHEVAARYLTLLAEQDADGARTALLAELAERDDIVEAVLLDDGATVLMQLPRGAWLGLDTYDHAALAADALENQSALSGDPPEPVDLGAAAKRRKRRSEAGLVRTPDARKALLLSTPHPDDPIAAYELSELVPLFRAAGWADEGIDVVERTTTEDLTPEDLFQLGDYGIILLYGHGGAGYFPGMTTVTHAVQCCDYRDFTAEVGAARVAEYEAWIAEGKMYLSASVDPATGASYESLSIRSDLWEEQVGTLPGSHVHFISCFSDAAAHVFTRNGAMDYLGWTHKAATGHAHAAMRSVLRAMLGETPSTDQEAYLALGDDEKQHAFYGPTSTLHLQTYMAWDSFLPAWAVVTLDGADVPPGTETITLDLEYAASALAEENESFAPFVDEHEFPDVLPGEAQFVVTARDAAGTVLGTGREDVTLHAGRNDVTVGFCRTRVEVSVHPVPETDVTVARVEIAPTYVIPDFGEIPAFEIGPDETHTLDDLAATAVTFAASALDDAGEVVASSAETFDLRCDTDVVEVPFGWVRLRSEEVTADTALVRVDITPEDPDLPVPAPVTYAPEGEAYVYGLRLGARVTFAGVAENAVGQELATRTVTHTVTAGENDVSLDFFQYGIILTADTYEVAPDGADSATVTATVRKWLPDDILAPTGDTVAGIAVEFDTSLGTLAGPNPGVTDGDGQCAVALSATDEGTATIHAFNEDDLVEATPIEIRFQARDYGVLLDLDPDVVVFDYGETPDPITATVTLRYFLPTDAGSPTGGPVAGKIVDLSDDAAAVTIDAPDPCTTGADGTIVATLSTERAAAGRLTVYIPDDVKGTSGIFRFVERDPASAPGWHDGSFQCLDENSGGWSVWVEWDKVDPAPREYHVFGYNFYDDAYYGHSFDGNLALGDNYVTDMGATIRFQLTGGGGNSCDPDGLAEDLAWGLGRFSGAIWLVTPVY